MKSIITSRYKFDSGRLHSQKRQHGQIVVYLLALLLATALVMMTVFNTGQLTSQKIKLDTTADAVAYSTATVEARGFNYLAYTNRAILANHASMAQLISFMSLARMLQVTIKTLAEDLDEIDPEVDAIPFVGEIIGPALTALATILDVAAGIAIGVVDTIKVIVTAMVYGLWGIDQAIWASQTVMVGATVESMVAVYNTVETANDPNVSTDVVAAAVAFTANAYQTIKFVDTYKRPPQASTWGADPDFTVDVDDPTAKDLKTVTADYKRWTRVATLDTDYFTRQREIVPNVAEAFPSFFNAISWLIPVKIQGGTNFVQFGDGSFGWNALDVISMKVPVVNISYSLGGGAVQVGNANTDEFRASGLGTTLEQYRILYYGNPNDTNAGNYANEMQKFGGLSFTPAVIQYWYAWLPFNVPAAPVVAINNQEMGALVNDPITSAAAVEGVSPTNPNYQGSGIETIGDKVSLPSFFYDVRNINQLSQYELGTDNFPGSVNAFTESAKAADPSDLLNGNYTPILKGGWDPRDDLGPAVDAPLQKATADMNTTSSIGFGTTSPTSNLKEGVENLRAFGKGQVYFKRPMDRWPRPDLTIVHRSLFDPYWDVRLAYPKLWERVTALVGYE